MKSEEITEQSLAENVWWWRPRAKNHSCYSPIASTFAFNYELVRRLYRTERFLPFPSLKAPYLEIILPLAEGKLPEMPVRPATEPQRLNEIGWTHDIHLQWNLNLPNHTLHKAFQELIDRERTSQKIAKPRPNLGKRNRGLSWRWPELMDIADLNIRVLNDAERKSLSLARARARLKKPLFDAAIEDFLEAKRTMTRCSLVKWVNLFSFGVADGWKGVWPRENNL